MGFTETSLQEHVTSEHAETSTEVVSMLHTIEIRACIYTFQFYVLIINDISVKFTTLSNVVFAAVAAPAA